MNINLSIETLFVDIHLTTKTIVLLFSSASHLNLEKKNQAQ